MTTTTLERIAIIGTFLATLILLAMILLLSATASQAGEYAPVKYVPMKAKFIPKYAPPKFKYAPKVIHKPKIVHKAYPKPPKVYPPKPPVVVPPVIPPVVTPPPVTPPVVPAGVRPNVPGQGPVIGTRPSGSMWGNATVGTFVAAGCIAITVPIIAIGTRSRTNCDPTQVEMTSAVLNCIVPFSGILFYHAMKHRDPPRVCYGKVKRKKYRAVKAVRVRG